MIVKVKSNDPEINGAYIDTIRHKGTMIEITPGWISVKDRMPGNNEDVLIYGEWKGASGTKYRELSLSDMEDYINQGYTPIAWMPIPEPPKEGTHDSN